MGLGILSFQAVFLISVLGSLCADCFWFLIGRYFPDQYIPQRIRERGVVFADNFKTVITHRRIFLSILLLKFCVGLRLFLILFFSRYPISSIRFFLLNVVGNILFVLILMLITIPTFWLFDSFFLDFHYISILFSILVVALFIRVISRNMLKKSHISKINYE